MRIYKHYLLRAWSNYAVLPEIWLAGRWLMERGFVLRERIWVIREQGKIVITPDEDGSGDL